MKINRMADDKLAPTWAFNKTESLEDLNLMTSADIKRFASLPSDLTEDELTNERDAIEQCVGKNCCYYCNASWNKEVKTALKEYASICGLKEGKFKVVHPEQVAELVDIHASRNSFNSVVKAASADLEYHNFRKAALDKELAANKVTSLDGVPEDKQRVILASIDSQWKAKNGNTVVLADPFKLDSFSDTQSDKREWEKVKLAQSLSDQPSLLTNAIKPVRGGEDYFSNSDINPAKGQNSITNPDAIKSFAENEVEDTGARLKREKLDREAKAKSDHKAWEQGKIDDMPERSIIAKGKVFPTEVMNAQPGIYKTIDPNDLPDRTAGESLRDVQQSRKQSIRGEEKKPYDFSIQKAAARSVSSDFAEELKKYLK